MKPVPAIPPRLLSISGTAQYLGLSKGALCHVPVAPIRLGRRILYDVREIDLWLDRRAGLAHQSANDGQNQPSWTDLAGAQNARD